MLWPDCFANCFFQGKELTQFLSQHGVDVFKMLRKMEILTFTIHENWATLSTEENRENGTES